VKPSRLLAVALAAAALTLAACGGDDNEQTSSATSTPSGPQCAKADLELKTGGQLTIATDKPAFPPYFEDNDPTNGKGFESAVAYAIADQLGFTKDEVKWTVVPFNASYKPGSKDFDFDVNQISINDQRKRAVDFSEPYFEAPQAVIAPKGSPAAGATSLADLKDATIGVQIGTTSLDAVSSSIQPSRQPKVFDDSNAVVTALK
jgi:polar amino acid transport system substrate-binding protein